MAVKMNQSSFGCEANRNVESFCIALTVSHHSRL